jgi:hypothetical protein
MAVKRQDALVNPRRLILQGKRVCLSMGKAWGQVDEDISSRRSFPATRRTQKLYSAGRPFVVALLFAKRQNAA